MDPILGSIILFAGNFAPRGWALCDGQLLPISQNTALFSILGTTYGGDGVQTFALPDLRGRAPIHAGHGPGLTPRSLGEASGQESVTLTINELPSHSHVVQAGPEPHGDPGSNILTAATQEKVGHSYTTPAGGNQPHNNMQPYVAVNYIIATEGIYPSRW